MAIKVRVEDTETGEFEEREIENDYIIVTAGQWYQHYVSVQGKTGDTHTVTLKRATSGEEQGR